MMVMMMMVMMVMMTRCLDCLHTPCLTTTTAVPCAAAGTPQVWSLGATRALLDKRLAAARVPESERASLHLLHGLLDW